MIIATLIALITFPNGEIHQYNEQEWTGQNATKQCVKLLQNAPSSASIKFQCIISKKD